MLLVLATWFRDVGLLAMDCHAKQWASEENFAFSIELFNVGEWLALNKSVLLFAGDSSWRMGLPCQIENVWVRSCFSDIKRRAHQEVGHVALS